MSARELSLGLVTLAALVVIVAAALILTVLRGLAIELADDVRASRTDTKRIRGTMQPKNTKLTDSVSQLRAANARLAALVGDTSRAAATLSDARQLASEVAMAGRSA